MKKNKTIQSNRPPIVTILGHVDHGKTTILDKIRKSSIQEKEVGGMTQGISVYSVKFDDKDITFIDTPGHEAFDLMRIRGGEVADIVLLIVAADDGVKPQTKESIEIIKNNKSNCIVVLNKIDITGVKVDKVQRQLSAEGVTVEALGGDIPCVEVSGKTGAGIDDLLNMILLVAEVNGLVQKPHPDFTCGSGVVLESSKDESLGVVTTIVALSGKFERGNHISYQGGKDKMKGFLDSDGNPIESINEGYGGKLIGLSKILKGGDKVFSISESGVECGSLFCNDSKVVTKEQEEKSDEDLLSALLGGAEKSEKADILNVSIKSCSQGSLDAVLQSIEKINKKEKIVNVVYSGVGDITISDVEYAKDSRAIVAGFSVSVDRAARDLAQKERVIIRTYKVIYELLNELEDAGVSLQLPTEEEQIVGEGNIKQVFTLSDGTKVLGMRVSDGEIKNGLKCRIIRGDEIISESGITSMRCGKERIDKATKDVECGVIISGKGDFSEGDLFQCYRIVKI